MKATKEILDILEEQGYDSLNDYFECLSEDYGVPVYHVEQLANLLGPNELFDGLVVSCMDAEGMY